MHFDANLIIVELQLIKLMTFNDFKPFVKGTAILNTYLMRFETF